MSRFTNEGMWAEWQNKIAENKHQFAKSPFYVEQDSVPEFKYRELAEKTQEEGGRFDAGNERRMARGLMGSYLVKASSEEAVFGTLSGGNQQKVILARWLRRAPGVLLLDEPTQGVDIGARHEIWGLVRDSLETTTVVVVSSDFDELATACDRVIVLRDGEVIATCQGDELTEARLNELAHSGVMEVDNPVAS